ncbi:MAG TPA: 4Fe-4S single cluster domain-containing protein [Hyphomicrobiaceae bacterium]|nr:4Fe-4S single cluster domain-containing protein [Hyphomicrobiaceae bacterium]
MNSELGLSRVHFPITALGPGRRIGIWFQGCSIRCAGCMSRDTWGAARETISVAALLQSITPWVSAADGVTVSGGEPFDQPTALLGLLKGLRAAGDLPVLVYSGFPYDRLRERHPLLLPFIDVLISEPFDGRQAVSAPLRGSANQRVSCLTERGVALWQQAEAGWREQGSRLDLIAERDGSVWLAGVPGPGDLDRLDRRLGAAGIRAHTSAGRLGDLA